MLEIIVIGLIFWLGYEVGAGVTAYHLRHLIYNEAKRLGLLKEEDDRPTVLKLETESVGDTILLYDRETKSFICQGNSLQQLAERCRQYNNIDYATVKHGEDFFAFFEGKVTDKV
jgi:hypothetical protein